MNLNNTKFGPDNTIEFTHGSQEFMTAFDPSLTPVDLLAHTALLYTITKELSVLPQNENQPTPLSTKMSKQDQKVTKDKIVTKMNLNKKQTQTTTGPRNTLGQTTMTPIDTIARSSTGEKSLTMTSSNVSKKETKEASSIVTGKQIGRAHV